MPDAPVLELRSVNARKTGAPRAHVFERKAKVFVAAPMSGASGEASYQAARDSAMSIVRRLRSSEPEVDAYFAGAGIASKAEFSPQGSALEQDIGFLRRSDVFILVYPEKVLSSVLIEAGYAMALRIPMILFVRRRSDLPYLLQEAESVQDRSLISPIAIREYADDEELADQAFEAVTTLSTTHGSSVLAR